MVLPEIKKRVLAWVEGEEYPFVGYYDGHGEWCMETSYLNCDNHRNDIFGEVIAWQELPIRPTPLTLDLLDSGDPAAFSNLKFGCAFWLFVHPPTSQ